MAWKKGKTKRPRYKLWSKNPRNVDTGHARQYTSSRGEQPGAVVLYRDHVKSHGSIKADAFFGDALATKPQGTPQTLIQEALQKFRNTPDANCPPVIATLRLRERMRQEGSHFGDKWRCLTLLNGSLSKLHCLMHTHQAYFVHEDVLLRTIRKSEVYKIEKVRKLFNLPDLVDCIHWSEVVVIPD